MAAAKRAKRSRGEDPGCVERVVRARAVLTGRVTRGTGLEIALRRIPQPQGRSALFAKTVVTAGFSQSACFVSVCIDSSPFGPRVETFWTPSQVLVGHPGRRPVGEMGAVAPQGKRGAAITPTAYRVFPNCGAAERSSTVSAGWGHPVSRIYSKEIVSIVVSAAVGLAAKLFWSSLSSRR